MSYYDNLHRTVRFLERLGFHKASATEYLYTTMITEGEDVGDIIFYKIERATSDSVTLEHWGKAAWGREYEYIQCEVEIEMDENLDNLTQHFLKRNPFKIRMRDLKLNELGI